MSHRSHPSQEPSRAVRPMLAWLGVSAASVALAAFTVTCSAQSGLDEDAVGMMLRPGETLAAADGEPAALPAHGWYRVTNKDGALQVRAVAAPLSVPGEEEAESVDTRYSRVPGARIAEGRLPTVNFADGVLAPRADHAYPLALGDTPFTLSVGGDGAVYTVHIGDQSYSYRLQGAEGSDSVIVAAADLDSDGKPDFIVQAAGQELLLLSSRTHPGLNPPAAVLALNSDGC